MSSYEDDIRRIAKQKDLKGGLSSIQEREPIPGSITPFIDEAFSPESSVTSTNDDGDETVTDGDYDPNDPTTFAKLLPVPAWPSGGSSNTNTNGTQDVEEVLDAKAGPVPTDSSSTTSGDLLPSAGGSIDGLTGLKDCATDQCVNVAFNGEFPTPDGWDGPDSPPVDPTYQDGYGWSVGITNPPLYATPQLAAESVAAVLPACAVASEWDEDGIPTLYQLSDSASGGDCGRGFGGSRRYVTAEFTEADAAPSEWPTDGCYDLAFQDGKFVTNSYDSEAPVSTSEPRSKINLCTASGRFVTILANAVGGTMMYETATGGGAPTGSMYSYNADGTLSMAGDATQQNIDSQLPR